MHNRLLALETPRGPQRVYANDTATTAAELPSAALYQNCSIYLTALKTFVVSNATSWIRQDTQGALA